MGYDKASCQFFNTRHSNLTQLKELLDVSNSSLEESFIKDLDYLSNKYINNIKLIKLWKIIKKYLSYQKILITH